MEAAKEATCKFWNENPCGTAASWHQSQELRFRVTDPYLLPYLDGPLFDGKRVLEVGCGQGLDGAKIVQRCRSYVGIDLSEASIEIACREVDAVKPSTVSTKFRVADAETLPFDTESFDAAYSIGVLHHTPNFDRAVAEIHRVLVPGGDCLLMLYRRYTPLWLVLRCVRGVLKTPFIGTKIKERFIEAQRRKIYEDPGQGTALLELFGCPIIATYTVRSIQQRFSDLFSILQVDCHRVGTDQIVRILPVGMRRFWPKRVAAAIERWGRARFGFYMLIHARKI